MVCVCVCVCACVCVCCLGVEVVGDGGPWIGHAGVVGVELEPVPLHPHRVLVRLHQAHLRGHQQRRHRRPVRSIMIIGRVCSSYVL